MGFVTHARMHWVLLLPECAFPPGCVLPSVRNAATSGVSVSSGQNEAPAGVASFETPAKSDDGWVEVVVRSAHEVPVSSCEEPSSDPACVSCCSGLRRRQAAGHLASQRNIDMFY